jgi:diadenosine tetraphosphatase ApaH/serine/threonine PP2A family protein phosphatase
LRAAVISDIHSNLPALEATIESIDAAGIEEIWCLGDVVGYGAQPDACADLIRERCAICLVGNHDLAVLGGLDIASFSETATEAVDWTRANVAERTLEFLRDLDPAGQRQDVAIFHASPRDPIWEYVLSTEQAEACLSVQAERIALIGHSHVALFFTRPDAAEPGDARGAQMSDGALLDLDVGRWLINPGSVGQPRDDDPRAAWLELNLEESTALFRRVTYDIERAAESILAAGLPNQLAERLFTGQ